MEFAAVVVAEGVAEDVVAVSREVDGVSDVAVDFTVGDYNIKSKLGGLWGVRRGLLGGGGWRD